MTALACVGDVIQYGDSVPSNVTRLRDAQGTPWGIYAVEDGDAANARWWPMTVIAVDPPGEPVADIRTKPMLELVEAYGAECVAGGAGATSDAELLEEIKRRCAALRSEGEGFGWIANILDGDGGRTR